MAKQKQKTKVEAKEPVVKKTIKRKIIKKSVKSFLEKHQWKILGIITIVGLIVRLYRIGYLTLWVDEYAHVSRSLEALKHKKQLFFGGNYTDNNGVFTTALTYIGLWLGGISEASARIPNAIFSVLSVPLIYLLGKRLFNKEVGYMSAIILAFSQYHIFWSRMARNYGGFSSAFIFLMLTFILLFEFKTVKGNSNKIYSKINWKHLLLLIAAFVLVILNHLIGFLFIFMAALYFVFTGLMSVTSKKENRFNNLHVWLAIPSFLGLVVVFSPLSNVIVPALLGPFFPKDYLSWFNPDWASLVKQYNGKEGSKSFDLYINVLKSDYPYFLYFGLAGLISSFFLKKKSAFFLISFFALPLILMGFIYREPNLPRYLIFIYPVFIISISAFLYYLFNLFVPNVLGLDDLHQKLKKYYTIGFLALMVFIVPRKEIANIIDRNEHGRVIKQELSNWVFPNWKEPCEYVNGLRKKDEVVLATVVPACKYYLGIDSVSWFRQNHLNPKTSDYEPNKPNGVRNSANSLEDLKRTYAQNKKGWLLADYYLDNVMTDPAARQFVFENMKYHFYASADGGVKVFSWDKSKQSKFPVATLVALGKKQNGNTSPPLQFPLKFPPSKKDWIFVIVHEGIDSDNEAAISINGNQVLIPKATGQYASNIGMEATMVKVPGKFIINGDNKIQLMYNDQCVDVRKGFAIYNIIPQ